MIRTLAVRGKLWFYLTPEQQAAVQALMPEGWEPCKDNKGMVELDLRWETLSEIDRLIRIPLGFLKEGKR